MSTRFYLGADYESVPVYVAPDAAWDDVSILVTALCKTSKRSLPMTTVSFLSSVAADKDILFRQYFSDPLVAGEIIPGSQVIKAQCRIQEFSLSLNASLALGIRVVDTEGFVQKVIVPVTRDDVEAALSALTNRRMTVTSEAGDYVIATGDRLVIEMGLGQT